MTFWNMSQDLNITLKVLGATLRALRSKRTMFEADSKTRESRKMLLDAETIGLFLLRMFTRLSKLPNKVYLIAKHRIA